ncbi:hypothetical protein NQ176_g3508 [Zarea fungicola]|uniref:Uncharacterized protein n=1 Tax=Zarea fungicola TaxID=93591 RepID=A0ACC1NKQ4_9HYPO|nr:hypothetical protein NQ176_g3508 [Lecanicillium fungicola]
MKTCTSATLLVLAGAASSIACDAPTINPTTLEVIKTLEGFRSDLYDDGYGTQHVGYGHACQKKDCAEVKYPIPISNADAEKLLLADLKGREGCVAENVDNKIVLNANQYGALVSFVFNVGCGNFADSTLLKRLNAGEKPSTVIEEELPQWRLAGGKIAPGLVERRKQEIALFNTPTSEPARRRN